MRGAARPVSAALADLRDTLDAAQSADAGPGSFPGEFWTEQAMSDHYAVIRTGRGCPSPEPQPSSEKETPMTHDAVHVDDDGPLVYTSAADIADAVAAQLADAPTVYVILNGRYSSGEISGTVLLETGDLLWSDEAADLDALKGVLVFDGGPRLAELIRRHPAGYRVEVIEGELPAALAEANRAFAASGLEVISDPFDLGGAVVACPNADAEGRCVDTCPACSGSGIVETEVTR